MLEIRSNGSKFAGDKPDTIEKLVSVLENYPLNPEFENRGDFIIQTMEYLNPELTEKYKNCTHFFGNFETISHVFAIITDEAEIIEKLTTAIEANQKSPEYLKIKEAKSEQIAAEKRRRDEEAKLMSMMKKKFRYSLKKTGIPHTKINCDVCKQPVDKVYYQEKERLCFCGTTGVQRWIKGFLLLGHKECLKGLRRA